MAQMIHKFNLKDDLATLGNYGWAIIVQLGT